MGWSFARLGARFGVSPTTVLHRLNESDRLLTRTCRLPECGRTIKTFDPRRVYCTKKHAKLDGARRQKGLLLVKKECALPECTEQIWAFEAQRKYCCEAHADLDWRRWCKHAHGTGVYARMILKSPACRVCGEPVVLDQHHVRFKGHKSDKKSQTFYLCPTHHMLIHRGFARLSIDGRYERLDAQILAALKRKQPDRVARILKE